MKGLKARLEVLDHVWNQGHSVTVTHYHDKLAREGGKGWYFKCDCGKRWAR